MNDLAGYRNNKKLRRVQGPAHPQLWISASAETQPAQGSTFQSSGGPASLFLFVCFGFSSLLLSPFSIPRHTQFTKPDIFSYLASWPPDPSPLPAPPEVAGVPHAHPELAQAPPKLFQRLQRRISHLQEGRGAQSGAVAPAWSSTF